MTEIRLDRVSTFGDQLSFLIPHDWIEADEHSDSYLYHAPNTDSGWFRVSLLTLKGTGKSSPEKIRTLLAERARKENGSLYERADNIVVAWEQISEEDGVPICNCWWAVARSLSPDLAKEALFSYTVVRDRRHEPETREMVSLIANLVADARFAQPEKSTSLSQ